MGSDPEPFTENLFLNYYGNKWPVDAKKRDLHKARFLNVSFYRQFVCHKQPFRI